MLTGLGARVHLFVRPAYRERFTHLFCDVLRCNVKELDFGLAQPIVLVTFPDRSSFSVEFSDLAHDDPPETPIDDERAFRGAWIEFRTRDVAGVQCNLSSAGIRSFSHPGSRHVYFSAPGGQMFRILNVDYQGP